MAKKRQTSFRLSEYFAEHLPKVAEEKGLPLTGTLETLLRECAEGHEEILSDPKVRATVQRLRDSSTPLEIVPYRLTSRAFEILDDLGAKYNLSRAEILESCVVLETAERS